MSEHRIRDVLDAVSKDLGRLARRLDVLGGNEMPDEMSRALGEVRDRLSVHQATLADAVGKIDELRLALPLVMTALNIPSGR